MGASCNCNKGADSEELALTDAHEKNKPINSLANREDVNNSHNKSLSQEVKIDDDKYNILI